MSDALKPCPHINSECIAESSKGDTLHACNDCGERFWNRREPAGSAEPTSANNAAVGFDSNVQKVNIASAGSAEPVTQAEADQLRAQNTHLVALYDAVANLVKVKGRHHTEQAYRQLVAAFDAARDDRPAGSLPISAGERELPPLPEPEYLHEDGTDEYGYTTYGNAYTAEQMQDYARSAIAHTAPMTDEHEAVNEMRLTLIGQIHELIDLADRFARRMHKQGDTEERDRIEGAIDYARKVSAPYNYNGPYRAVLAAQQEGSEK